MGPKAYSLGFTVGSNTLRLMATANNGKVATKLLYVTVT